MALRIDPANVGHVAMIRAESTSTAAPIAALRRLLIPSRRLAELPLNDLVDKPPLLRSVQRL